MHIVVNEGRGTKLEFSGDDRAMGGIPTALWALCTRLAARGHDIHLFGRCKETGTKGRVTVHARSEFAGFVASHPPDVLLLLPELLPLLMPARTRARVVWSHDAHSAGDSALAVRSAWAQNIGRSGEWTRLYGMALLRPYFDRIVVGSQWHAEQLTAHLGVPRERVRVSYLGVSGQQPAGAPAFRYRHRLVYASRGRRGLDVLLGLFPQIRSDLPDAELHVFGYGYTDIPPELRACDQAGVVWRGCLSKRELAHEFRSAAVMTYPSRHTETFCLAVAEAQAAGLPVVTSRSGALVERVDDGVDGYVIGSDVRIRAWLQPDQPDFQSAFVAAVVRLLTDDETWREMGVRAAQKARSRYDWNQIVDRWEADLEHLITGRVLEAPRIDPALDLLDPTLLTLEERGARAQVPAPLAEQWLRSEWASYGYDSEHVPGLPRPPRSA